MNVRTYIISSASTIQDDSIKHDTTGTEEEPTTLLGMTSQHTTIASPAASSSGGSSGARVQDQDPGSLLLQAESQMTNLTRFDASRRKSKLSLIDDPDDYGGRRRGGGGAAGSLLTKIMGEQEEGR